MEENLTLQTKNEAYFTFRVRLNMFLMLAGKFVSLSGSSIYGFAIGLYVLKVTGSGLNFAATLFFNLLPAVILGPFAGAIADSFDRKKMVVLMDFFSGLIVLGLYILAIFDGLYLPYIYLTAALLSICSTFLNVSFDASIPNIVDDRRLMRLNSLNQVINSLAQIIGPMLGGVVFGLFDIKFFLLINGLSFIFSGISELFIDFQLTVNKEQLKEKERVSLKKVLIDLKEGFSYIRDKSILFTIFTYALVINFFSHLGYSVPVPYIINEIIKMTPTQFGIISGSISFGLLIGGLVLSVLPEFKSKYKVLFVCLMVASLTMLLTGVPGLPAFQTLNKQYLFFFYCIITFIMGVNNVFFNVPVIVMLQRETPDQLRGRVFGHFQTIVLAVSPISYILAGILIGYIPAYVFPIGSAIIIFLFVMTIFIFNQELKKL